MTLLIDSQALIWYVDQDQLLSRPAHAAITNPANQLYLSAATLFEIAIKTSVKKLNLSLPYKQWLDAAIIDLGLTVLPITTAYGEALTNLPFHHRDPFDRLIVAQALVEQIPVVSNDSAFDSYGVTRLW